MARNDQKAPVFSPVAQAPKGRALTRKTVNVTLDEPIEANGDECSMLTLRKPCAGDLGQCAGMDEVSTALHLVHLCGTDEKGRGLAPSAVAQIALADFAKLGEVIGDFFSSSPTTGEKS